MKKFEGLIVTGLVTATLAGGCGETKQQSPEVVNSLSRTIERTARAIANRAIRLSKGDNAKFTVYYDNGETSLTRIVDNSSGGFDSVDITFSGDESQVGFDTLKSIQVDTANCQEVKGKTDCKSGETETIFAPAAKYEGQKAWEAKDEGYITLKENDPPEGYTIDSVNDFAEGESAVPTAKDIVSDIQKSVRQIIAAPDF